MILLEFKKLNGKGVHWINPDNISSVATGTDKEGNDYTVLHMNSQSEPKIFIKEKPAELNKIFKKYQKKEYKIEEV
jgi:hypothetical protein